MHLSQVTNQGYRVPTLPVQGYANPARPRLADPPSQQTLAGTHLGLPWIIRFDNPTMLSLGSIRATVEAALSRTAAQLDTLDPASSISRFNRATPLSQHRLEPQFAQALACALRWAALSDGVFDPTVGTLLALIERSEQCDHSGRVRRRAHQVPLTSWRDMKLDGGTRTVVQPGGMWLDLTAVANGVAVDHIASLLHVRQIHNFTIQLGGELRADGHSPRNEHWEASVDVGVSTPVRLGLSNLSISTAKLAQDASHVGAHRARGLRIDPRNGDPPKHTSTSVSVLHRDCRHADALSTLLAVLGPGQGLAFAKRHKLAAMFICPAARGYVARHSDEWQKLVKPERPSVDLDRFDPLDSLR